MNNCLIKEKQSYFSKLNMALCSVIVFLLLALFFVLWLDNCRYKSLQKQMEAQIFISQIINSVIADTEFYRGNSKSRVIKDIESCRDSMSHHYTVSTIDYSWDIYEAKILFDNGASLKFDVAFRENKPLLSHLRVLKKRIEIGTGT